MIVVVVAISTALSLLAAIPFDWLILNVLIAYDEKLKPFSARDGYDASLKKKTGSKYQSLVEDIIAYRENLIVERKFERKLQFERKTFI